MLILGIGLGLVLGLLAGGSLGNLAAIRLRWTAVLFGAVILRFVTEAGLNADIGLVEALRLPLIATAFGLLLAGLWVNRTYPGLVLAFVGILSNAIVIVVNGGHMPIWGPSALLAGFDLHELTTTIHVVENDLDAFLVRLGPLADVIPIPFDPVRNVASIGDIFLTIGLAFFLFAGTVRTAPEVEASEAGRSGDWTGLPGAIRLPRPIAAALAAPVAGRERRLAAEIAGAAALDRPLVLGSAGAAATLPTAQPIPRPAPEVLERVRRHPYVRLALNGSFSALWAGQLVSLFGDRMHQVALAAVVLLTTGSPLATGLVFMVATLPNLVFSPIAGTFVDRWEHKEVLIVSDLLRAAVVLLIPIAIAINIVLVYPLVFVLTTISIFFRPARVAILPRIVSKDELLTANSALWVAETGADVIGYPLAAVFVASLGAALPLAFWIDAATYVGSAILLLAIAVAPRTRRDPEEEAPRGVTTEMVEGWRFLRREPTLLANTAQATVAQFAIGGLVALAIVYAERVLDGSWGLDFKAIYGFLETGIGVGNLLGGFVIGLVGSRLAKGRMIIGGYVAMGLCLLLLAWTSDLAVALGLMFGIGVANMVFVIPSQTLFQERTPSDLMGRVIGFRFALVGGAMTIAMGLGGILGEFLPVTAVVGVFGVTTLVAGLAGLFVPAIRDA